MKILLLAVSFALSQAHEAVDLIAELSANCTIIETPVLGCTNTDPGIFSVTYPDGEIQCKAALTLEQSAKEPTLSLADNDNVTDDDYFTILLVDTAQSFFHPIIHFGASNIPGSSLTGNQELVLADATPFIAYRGPQYIPGIPGIDNRLAHYEWIVAKQDSFVETPDLPVIEGSTNFEYNDYLASVNGTALSTLYFSSGFCVQEIENKKGTKKSSKATKGAKKSSKALKVTKGGKATKEPKNLRDRN